MTKSPSAPAQISFTGSEHLNPARNMIHGGTVQLNRTCQYLEQHLPDEAKADLFWSPLSCAEAFRGRSRDTAIWVDEIANIRNLGDNDEFHVDNKPIKGMKIFDYYEDGYEDLYAHSGWYDNERAKNIVESWSKAQEIKQSIITGATLPTPELLRGYQKRGEYYAKYKTKNLYSDLTEINNRITEQNKENGLNEQTGLVEVNGSGYQNYQHSSASLARGRECIVSVQMSNHPSNTDCIAQKRYDLRPARFCVLKIQAPK